MLNEALPSPFEIRRLAADVARLSELLTKGRGTLNPDYLRDRGLREAYLHYFLPANRHKIFKPLSELSIHPRDVLKKKKLRVLDIGAGPGTAILGIIDFFSGQANGPHLEFTAVDRVAANLDMARELFGAGKEDLRLDAQLTTIVARAEELQSLLKGGYDLIVLSNSLNEIFSSEKTRVSRRAQLLGELLGRYLRDDGSCIIVEPALRETSRELLMLRDIVVSAGFRIYSPCLTSIRCPVLENPKDWCHEDIPWTSTPLVKAIDDIIGLRKDSLKFSYLVVRKDGLSLSDCFPPSSSSWRVVSEPLPSKGKLEYFLCGTRGRRLAVRLDKDRSESNKSFDVLKRGKIFSLAEETEEGRRLRIGRTAIVDTESPPKTMSQ